MNSHALTLQKTLSWRLIASAITGALSVAVTGSWATGLAIGGADTAIKLVAYYLHERAWLRVAQARAERHVEPPQSHGQAPSQPEPQPAPA
ncbi:MAG: DUF2061 domain-containing protein [Myxococcales bacterium]|nr:DUF2061 domain-containing protein [Myxococcales bacterium]